MRLRSAPWQISRHVLAGAVLLVGALASAAIAVDTPVAPNADRIRPYAANPWYWQYKGKPVLLMGGSDDDNLAQLPNLKAHLDDLAAVGANYVRGSMSDRPDADFEVYPFRRYNGQYDLDHWNDEYWRRFANFLRWTYERDIFVQIEVWDRWDYSQQYWRMQPYNPANNINYTFEESGFEAEYPGRASKAKQPFFYTTPKQQNNMVVLKYQQKFVEEMLRHALPYPHVLYCIDNETHYDEAWFAYWTEFIRERGKKAGQDVFVTSMYNNWKLQDESHRRIYDKPDLYDFVEVSQNTHQQGQTHWDNLQWARNYMAKRPRPINVVKTYGHMEFTDYGNHRDGLERWWRHLIGGVAATRFHRDDGGLGFLPPAQASIRAARKLESLVKPWEVEPANDLLRSRDENEAYLAADPGRAYALYFTHGGEVELDLRDARGTFDVRWIDIEAGDWGPHAMLSGGDWEPLRAPTSGHWVAALLPASSTPK